LQIRKYDFGLILLQIFDMTAEEIEESQSGIEDSGVGGPGAPTPLSALEVSLKDSTKYRGLTDFPVS
jgi:hypothetical protein